MPPIFYGGPLYGAVTAFYGRIASALQSAQDSFVRETALKASIIDERSNRWEFVTGVNQVASTSFRSLGNNATQQDYWSYRLRSGSDQKANGDIVRVRIGDGSTTDFGIYIQTITDPTNLTQWNTWTLLYSGTHYAVNVQIANDGSTVHVYSAKSNGLYRDNVLKWSHAGIIIINTVQGLQDALFISVVSEDPVDGDGKFRDMTVYFTSDSASVTPTRDPVNYRWYDTAVNAIWDAANSRLLRYQFFPRYDPRSRNNGDSITVCTQVVGADPTAPRIIRGLAGEVGHNMLRNIYVSKKLADGYYYMFYTEEHRDDEYDLTENHGAASHWQRSKDGIHWSEPVASGTPIGTGIVRSGGYYYFTGWAAVWRRPDSPVVYDVTNYVTKANFDIPRDNQESSGECTVANPDGVNDVIENLSDRRLKLEVGLRGADGNFEYVEYNDWWIKRAIKNIEGEANRVTVQFGDVWTRLNSTLRDTFNFIGQLKWRDWSAGKRNKAFNYYFVTDTAPRDASNKLVTKGIVLYTGWKGQNGTAQVHFSGVSGNPALIFRYVDTRNYQRVEKQGSTIKLIDKVNNVDSTIASGSCASDTSPTIKLVFKWETYEIYVNGVLELSGTYQDQPNVKPGYVGFKANSYTITSFSLDDWEPTITGEELIRTALAMGDYHDVITGETSSEELAIIWGPQTDAPTPADGLRQALEATKWDLVWNNGVIQIGSFKDATITRVIDNRIIKTDYVDEANRHINLAAVDGNEDPWTETDVIDTQQRDRQISAYFDLPELTNQDAVRNRAMEEIRKGKLGRTPGGDVPLYFDLWRMDAVTWIDNSGESNDVRVEGISVTIDQGMSPSQRETLDTSLLNA